MYIQYLDTEELLFFFQYHNLTWILRIHQAWAIAFYWQNWAPHFHPLSGFGQQAWPLIVSCSRLIMRMSDQICRWILFYGIPNKMYLPYIFAEDIAFAKNQLNRYLHRYQTQVCNKLTNQYECIMTHAGAITTKDAGTGGSQFAQVSNQILS